MTIRFVMIGGFLGAGKTTAIGRLAKRYADAGKRVGLVTNDQAYDLVDTKSLRAQGFDVEEVPGACFCCKFDDLTETLSRLGEESKHDIIIAEPVGSCTDLAATVIEPLRQIHGDQYELGPLAVLLKPEHGRKILQATGKVGFSPKAAYIFLKQIEEADIVVIHKADKLSSQDVERLVSDVNERFPGKVVLAASARTGDGFDQFEQSLSTVAPQRSAFMEVDYDIYAQGEAELGWLNCQAELSSKAEPFAIDIVLVELVKLLRDALLAKELEPAHLKVLAESGASTAIANLVGSDADVELSFESGTKANDSRFVVNARVAADPEELETIVRATVEQVAIAAGLDAKIHGMQRFRPSPPVPTHRLG